MTRSQLHLFDAILILVISVISVYAISVFVPFSMDEFYQYNPLAAFEHPMNDYNVFHESAAQYKLAPFGHAYLPLRSFHYTGTLPCALYYPLYKLWPEPYSARLLGLLMLGAQAYLLYGLFRIRPLFAFVGLLLFMPYAFQHICDTGPVSFQTTSVFIIAFLSIKHAASFGESRIKDRLFPALIGIVIFLNIWTKLTFFFIIPGLLILAVYNYLRSRKMNAPAIFQSLAITGFTASIPSIALFLSRDISGHRYFVQLLRTDETNAMGTGLAHFIKTAVFILNPISTAHRIYGDFKEPVTLVGIILFTTITAALIAGVLYFSKKRQGAGLAIASLFIFIASYLLIAFHPKTWAMHHVVLSYPFLILAIAGFVSAAGLKRSAPFLTAAAVCSASLYANLAFLRPLESEHPSKIELNDYINQKYSREYAQIVVDWGFYYIKALYGPKDQCVIYINPLNKTDQVDTLKIMLEYAKRKPLFILRLTSESDLSMIRANFQELAEEKTSFDTGDWRIWRQP